MGIVIAPSDISVFEDNSVLFTCVALGDPLTAISWHRTETGMLLENGTSYGGRVSVFEEIQGLEDILFVVSILEICSTELGDMGGYQCRANNFSGYDMASFNLTVEIFYGERRQTNLVM